MHNMCPFFIYLDGPRHSANAVFPGLDGLTYTNHVALVPDAVVRPASSQSWQRLIILNSNFYTVAVSVLEEPAQKMRTIISGSEFKLLYRRRLCLLRPAEDENNHPGRLVRNLQQP